MVNRILVGIFCATSLPAFAQQYGGRIGGYGSGMGMPMIDMVSGCMSVGPNGQHFTLPTCRTVRERLENGQRTVEVADNANNRKEVLSVRTEGGIIREATVEAQVAGRKAFTVRRTYDQQTMFLNGRMVPRRNVIDVHGGTNKGKYVTFDLATCQRLQGAMNGQDVMLQMCQPLLMTLGNVLKDANAALKKEGLKLGAMTMAGFNATNPASSIKEADGDHLMSALGVVMSCQAYLNPMPTGGMGNYQYQLPTPNQNNEGPSPNNSSTEAQREARN